MIREHALKTKKTWPLWEITICFYAHFEDCRALVASATEAANKTGLPFTASSVHGNIPNCDCFCNSTRFCYFELPLTRGNNIYSSSKCCYPKERCVFWDLKFLHATSSTAKIIYHCGFPLSMLAATMFTP